MKMKVIFTAAIMVAVIAATYAATIPNTPTERDAATEALPVTTITLRPIQSIERNREFSGTLRAARRSSLAFERSARLINVHVDEGERVEAGQPLAVLDTRQLKIQILQTTAMIQQQTAILTELTNGPRTELIAATKSKWQAAEADASLRKATLERVQSLYQRQSTSAQQLDEAQLAYESAAAQQEALYKQFEELQKGTRPEQIDAQAASVDSLEAEKEHLEISLTDSILRAPFAGTITKRMADEGDMLTPGTPVLELVESDQLEAHIGLPPRFIQNLAVGDSYSLTTDQIQVQGTLQSIVAQVDPTTRTQTVILKVNDAAGYQLADGQLIKLGLEEMVRMDGFRVPTTALSSGSRGLWKAYIAEPSATASDVYEVADRAVEILHTDGNWSIVRGTVYAGERLITSGVHRVVPGQLVRITESDNTINPN